MAPYRFTGTRQLQPSAQTGPCCEPVCGPATCGTSSEVKAAPVAVLAKEAEERDGCCEPECSPTTCP